jgi:hypothetical protein
MGSFSCFSQKQRYLDAPIAATGTSSAAVDNAELAHSSLIVLHLSLANDAFFRNCKLARLRKLTLTCPMSTVDLDSIMRACVHLDQLVLHGKGMGKQLSAEAAEWLQNIGAADVPERMVLACGGVVCRMFACKRLLCPTDAIMSIRCPHCAKVWPVAQFRAPATSRFLICKHCAAGCRQDRGDREMMCPSCTQSFTEFSSLNDDGVAVGHFRYPHPHELAG